MILDSHNHSLLLVVTDDTGRLDRVVACDGIDPVLQTIAEMVTAPDESDLVGLDVVRRNWSDFCRSGQPRSEFLFSRPNHRLVSHLRFAMIATAEVETAS